MSVENLIHGVEIKQLLTVDRSAFSLSSIDFETEGNPGSWRASSCILSNVVFPDGDGV